jgi:voltage-gated potassium channel
MTEAIGGTRTPAAEPMVRRHSNAYNIFILVLTVMSLIVMALLILPVLTPATNEALLFFDNVICFVFLADFAYNLAGSHPRGEYFIKRRGWLDLMGSIPALGFFKLTALLRLARLSRLARIMRLLNRQNKRELVEDIVQNRSQYAMFVTLLLVFIVLSTASIAVLQFESKDPAASIQTGGDALWWAIVTLTTVGYGDFYPVTMGGRFVGVGVMLAGIGLIGALASLLASLLVSPAPTPSVADDEAAASGGDAVAPATVGAPADASLQPQLEAMQAELAAIRSELRALRTPGDATSPASTAVAAPAPAEPRDAVAGR